MLLKLVRGTHKVPRSGKQRQGFTLIELSIVVVIISLLVAAISVGKNMVAAQQLNNAIKEIANYDAVFTLFKQKYDYAPGDMPNATTYWPSAYNGNGNGAIDMVPNNYVSSGESYYAWQHLSLSGMISGNYTGQNSGINNGWGGDAMAPGV
ncbi:MAG: Tfp pilus assembly protein FimT/FimU, partial [Gammaproteobacteria bacterium]